ncbi:MAG: IS630 family transposase [Acidobacteria bacterium]|nr:IS630 family transposase [Acidobacteriota bacterium]
MWNPAAALDLPSEQRQLLQSWINAKNTPQKVAFRARVVMMASEGRANRDIARTLETSRPTVLLWRERFAAQGPQALLEDAPGRGRKAQIPVEKVRTIVEATLHSRPPAATHWSVRTMAKAQGVSPATVQRIWDAHGLEPHRVKTFKLSRDKHFVEKLTDVVGLYLNPPDKALVLCVDEKSQIQALDRTQPGLPMKRGRCGTMTHDYKRHGTTTLFAALNVLEGTVIGHCMPRHRHQEFLKFLRQLDREIPTGLDLHMILDNYGTHKHPGVQSWLAKHPRFHLHFTPTSSSWLNLVERWFRELTEKRIRRGTFASVKELVAAIREYLDHNNQQPRPFVWKASTERILEKVARCKAIYETLH